MIGNERQSSISSMQNVGWLSSARFHLGGPSK